MQYLLMAEMTVFREVSSEVVSRAVAAFFLECFCCFITGYFIMAWNPMEVNIRV